LSTSPDHLLFVFLDGLGVGESDPAVNPLLNAKMPTLRALAGGDLPLLAAGISAPIRNPARGWVAADATLGVPGRPQSGTGQTSLLTGENAAVLFGRHFGPWVPTGLRDLLARQNILTRGAQAGLQVSFANAYPATAYRTPDVRRPAAPPLAARAAGVLVRHEADLRDRRAVSSEITNDRWRRHRPDIGEISAEEAGGLLADLAREADLTLFAHYDTDLVGHRRDPDAAVAVLNRVDRFLTGLMGARSPDTLLVIASDHGNIEDLRVGHTTNPVPVIAAGPGAESLLAGVRSITDVTPAILRTLNVNWP